MSLGMDDKRRRNMLVIFAVIFLVGLYLVMEGRNEPLKIAYYPTFKTLIQEKKFSEVNIVEKGNIYGRVREGGAIVTENGKTVLKLKVGDVVSTPTPNDPKLAETLETSGTKYSYVAESSSFFSSPLFNIFLTVAFFIFIFWIINRQMGRGQKDAAQLTKSNARLVTDSKVTFADVAGIDSAKQEIEEIVDFLKNPSKYTRLGSKFPRGTLLVGKPGTGKTLLARAMAGEAGVPFLSITGTEFVQMFVGVGAARVRDLFAEGKKHKSCIIFIDELDAVGQTRGVGHGFNNDEREQTLLQLIAEMDGFENNREGGIIVLAATNRPERLDAALTRPGRFDRKIEIGLPDIEGREAILLVHARGKQFENLDDLKELAKLTYGMSGADLANIVNEASIAAGRHGKEKITKAELTYAYDRVSLGAEQSGHRLPPRLKPRVAYHEAGHAIVGKVLASSQGINNILRKVTIIPRGEALGLTVFMPTEEIPLYNETELAGMMAMTLGGRVAEKIKFGEYSSGAANDIMKATDVAFSMVEELGMSKKIGPLCLHRRAMHQYLNQPMDVENKTLSNEKNQEIEAEAKCLVLAAETLASEILSKYATAFEKTAELLMQKETIDGEEIDPFILEVEQKQ